MPAKTEAEDQFARLVSTLVAASDDAYGTDESKGARRMFASTSIKTRGKMFAFLRKKEHLVVKLSEPRVDELVAAGEGDRFDPGDGKLQREWFVLNSTSAEDWLALATEAEAYVGKR
jgi:hypothetical protein